jgi:hypothetical protein
MHEVLFAPETATEGEVWVNTRFCKYFKPGSRYYGKTKEGKFMTELDALDSGTYQQAGPASSICEETRS